jgi:hypothetical protein
MILNYSGYKCCLEFKWFKVVIIDVVLTDGWHCNWNVILNLHLLIFMVLVANNIFQLQKTFCNLVCCFQLKIVVEDKLKT